jgi:hypothetical protein
LFSGQSASALASVNSGADTHRSSIIRPISTILGAVTKPFALNALFKLNAPSRRRLTWFLNQQHVRIASKTTLEWSIILRPGEQVLAAKAQCVYPSTQFFSHFINSLVELIMVRPATFLGADCSTHSQTTSEEFWR